MGIQFLAASGSTIGKVQGPRYVNKPHANLSISLPLNFDCGSAGGLECVEWALLLARIPNCVMMFLILFISECVNTSACHIPHSITLERTPLCVIHHIGAIHSLLSLLCLRILNGVSTFWICFFQRPCWIMWSEIKAKVMLSSKVCFRMPHPGIYQAQVNQGVIQYVALCKLVLLAGCYLMRTIICLLLLHCHYSFRILGTHTLPSSPLSPPYMHHPPSPSLPATSVHSRCGAGYLQHVFSMVSAWQTDGEIESVWTDF